MSKLSGEMTTEKKIENMELKEKILSTFNSVDAYMKFPKEWCQATVMCNHKSQNKEKLKRWGK